MSGTHYGENRTPNTEENASTQVVEWIFEDAPPDPRFLVLGPDFRRLADDLQALGHVATTNPHALGQETGLHHLPAQLGDPEDTLPPDGVTAVLLSDAVQPLSDQGALDTLIESISPNSRIILHQTLNAERPFWPTSLKSDLLKDLTLLRSSYCDGHLKLEFENDRQNDSHREDTPLLANQELTRYLDAVIASQETHGDPEALENLEFAKEREDLLRNELEAHRTEAATLRRQLANTRRRLNEVYRSARYRLGSAIADSARTPSGLVKLPWRILQLFRTRKSQARSLPAGLPSRYEALKRDDGQFRHFEQRFERFLEHVRASSADTVVFLLSGTIEIQRIRGNRPIRLTQAYLRANTPVFFSYHRWRGAGSVPKDEDPNLFQSPIDYTLAIANRLATADLGDKKKVFLVSYPIPGFERFVNRFNTNGWYTLYDCRDDWEEFAKVGAAKWYRSDLEKFAVANTDVTTCVSRPLRDKIAKFTSDNKVLVSQNGLDPAFVSEDYVHAPSGTTTTIGYFGHLSANWFDWDTLKAAAIARPKYQFELIGHSEPDDLDLPDNITILGPKVPEEICQIASRWDVGIIPFIAGPLTAAVDPIKIYEYLALRLPALVIGMPQVHDYPWTTLVSEPEDFLPALDRLVKSPPQDTKKVEQFLKDNTWDVRARELINTAVEFGQRSPKPFLMNLNTTQSDKG